MKCCSHALIELNIEYEHWHCSKNLKYISSKIDQLYINWFGMGWLGCIWIASWLRFNWYYSGHQSLVSLDGTDNWNTTLTVLGTQNFTWTWAWLQALNHLAPSSGATLLQSVLFRKYVGGSKYKGRCRKHLCVKMVIRLARRSHLWTWIRISSSGYTGIYCGYWCRHRSKDCSKAHHLPSQASTFWVSVFQQPR